MASDSRARLIAYLCQAGLSTARANAVLDDYAHGLAEQIRAAWTNHDPGKPGNVTMLSPLNAADLIDPKAGAEA
ncbi:hypothetical protein ACJ6WD_10070 [Streptomyces sp. VTCC 41912]|uniref:hypothetical protein n=1 Tax=Streptomyces sp. VTCC 41912 TaxID=3383243 RepID=UPI003896BD1C